MDMLGEMPVFDLHNKQWPIHPARYEGPAASVLKAEIENCVISEGAIIRNAKIVNSIIRSDVVIEDNALVVKSIRCKNRKYWSTLSSRKNRVVAY